MLSLTNSKEKGDCHFTKNKVVTSRVILLRDVRHITHGTHQEKTIYCDKIMINISCTTIACSIILSSVKLEKSQHSGETITTVIWEQINKIPWQIYLPSKQKSSDFSPLSLPKTIAFISSGANKQKIKLLAHSQCNVRASKNAEQAFSTQWYLYSCNGLFFLFSSVP